DRLRGDRVKDPVNPAAPPVKALPDRDPEPLRFLLGDRMALGVLGQLGNRLLQTGIPAGGRRRRPLGQPTETLHRLGAGTGLDQDPVGLHRAFFLFPASVAAARICFISANISSMGVPFPAFISSTAWRSDSISSARSASSMSF